MLHLAGIEPETSRHASPSPPARAMCIVEHPLCCCCCSSSSSRWRTPAGPQPRAEEEEEWNPRPQIKTKLDDFALFAVDEEEEEEDDDDDDRMRRRLKEAAGGCHSHRVSGNECSSVLIQRVEAPVSAVWSLVRNFGEPQGYKPFVRSCSLLGGRGDLRPGCLREVRVISGLPATTSVERLDLLDEKRHILGFSVIGGDHRLENYRSITSVHEVAGAPSRCKKGRRPERSVVVESYAVEVPEDNTVEETRQFVETIIKCNLRSLDRTSQSLAEKSPP